MYVFSSIAGWSVASLSILLFLFGFIVRGKGTNENL